VHFDIKDGKQWFWQPSKTLKAVDGVSLRLYEGESAMALILIPPPA
jgi:oligopeptide transport system ATP-binding protein